METTLFNNDYRINKLDAVKQFHVARRVAPVVLALGTSISDFKDAFAAISAGGSDLDLLAAAAPAIKPVVDVISSMGDEDVEYVINTCLLAVQRKVQNPGGNPQWAPVKNGPLMQFQDILMPQMVRLVIEVLRYNLGNFFPLPSAETSSAQSS